MVHIEARHCNGVWLHALFIDKMCWQKTYDPGARKSKMILAHRPDVLDNSWKINKSTTGVPTNRPINRPTHTKIYVVHSRILFPFKQIT